MQKTDQADNNRLETEARPSRASPLPQKRRDPCGSELARDEAGRAEKVHVCKETLSTGALRCNEPSAPLRSQ